MIRRSVVLIAITPILLLGVHGCRRQDDRIAARLSNLATTPDQKRLWQQAGDQALATGISKLDQTRAPVAERTPSRVADQVIPAQVVGPSLPASVRSAVRITASVGLDKDQVDQQAIVTDVDATGERFTVSLGGTSTISFLARADGRPLGFTRGQTLNVAYRASNEANSGQFFGVRAPNGRGIARATETGRKPLSVTVPLFNVMATQITVQPNSPYTNVDVRVGNDHQTMMPGQIMPIGGVTVGLILSRALTGPQSKSSEGSPYALELIAWK